MYLTPVGIAIALVVCLLVGVFGYLLAAACDRRRRDLDVYDTQIKHAADKIGLLDAWARITNEIQHPSDTKATDSAHASVDLHAKYDSYDHNYLIIPRTLLRVMPALWRARLNALLADLQATAKVPWPRYVVTTRDPNPPHHFQKDPLLG